ncbi:MAG: aspartyl/asparaginyl beta-hydroxylase domain-containing protein [Pseudomonadota bacterium]
MNQVIDSGTQPEKPATLKRPLRKRVKKLGKRLTRLIASHQARVSKVPNTPFLDPALFPAIDGVRAEWEAVRDEVEGVLRFRDAIPGFEDVSPDQYRIAQAKNWRTFILYGFGERLDRNCAHAPRTAELLAKIPNLQTAWFSILAPGYHIPAHTGVTKGILRAHLGLIVPKERERCRIRVGDEIRAWAPGELMVLDDTYEHEVWNDTEDERVILLFDFDRPMGWSGRLLNWTFLRLMKFTAFYREPRKNLADYEERFEAAASRANETLERLADP